MKCNIRTWAGPEPFADSICAKMHGVSDFNMGVTLKRRLPYLASDHGYSGCGHRFRPIREHRCLYPYTEGGYIFPLVHTGAEGGGF